VFFKAEEAFADGEVFHKWFVAFFDLVGGVGDVEGDSLYVRKPLVWSSPYLGYNHILELIYSFACLTANQMALHSEHLVGVERR